MFNGLMANFRIKTLIVSCIFINTVTLFYLYMRVVSQSCIDIHLDNQYVNDRSAEYLVDLLTVVIYDYEHFSHDIHGVVQRTHTVLPDIRIAIVSEKPLYPPIKTNNTLYAEMVTQVNVHGGSRDFLPENFIKTEFVLIAPDGIKIDSQLILTRAKDHLKVCYPSCYAVAIAIDPVLECVSGNISAEHWTLSFKENRRISIEDNSQYYAVCDFILGKHALIMRRADFLDLPKPFVRPFPEALYIFMAARKWSTYIYKDVRLDCNGNIYKDHSTLWRHRVEHSERRKELMRSTGIKLVVHRDGREEWYGCDRHSNRCFGTVEHDIPEFIYQHKMTPPCCLKALRETGRYVFKTLDDQNIRYWLEGGSLLGAARSGDIIPWDYDIDIGIYRTDLYKCKQLQTVVRTNTAFVEDGFVWEKAEDGDFYRVQYSETNHMHVDIFPFYSRDGIMTKDTWFKTHRQDREFPEHYLRPLTKIHFIGYNAGAPNNVKQFLDFKFGEGVIENPRFPNDFVP